MLGYAGNGGGQVAFLGSVDIAWCVTCLVLNLKFDSSTYRGLTLYVGTYCDRGVFDRYLTDRGVLGTCDLVFQNTPKKSRSKCSVEYTCSIQGRMKFVVARHDDLPLSVFLCLEDLDSSQITVPSRGGIRVTGILSSKDIVQDKVQ